MTTSSKQELISAVASADENKQNDEISSMIQKRITDIANQFTTNITAQRTQIYEQSKSLHSHIQTMKDLYLKLVDNTVNNDINFGLNSFHFQTHCINEEYQFLKLRVVQINNHMYCEYYKILKRIINYMKSTRNIFDREMISRWDKLLHQQFPVYKDLERDVDYSFGIIKKAHDCDIQLIGEIFDVYCHMISTLKQYKETDRTGINITNYVNSYRHSIKSVEDVIVLYLNYLEFFYEYQTKMLKRFYERILQLNEQMKEDIHLNKEDIDEDTGMVIVGGGASAAIGDFEEEPNEESIGEEDDEHEEVRLVIQEDDVFGSMDQEEGEKNEISLESDPAIYTPSDLVEDIHGGADDAVEQEISLQAIDCPSDLVEDLISDEKEISLQTIDTPSDLVEDLISDDKEISLQSDQAIDTPIDSIEVPVAHYKESSLQSIDTPSDSVEDHIAEDKEISLQSDQAIDTPIDSVEVPVADDKESSLQSDQAIDNPSDLVEDHIADDKEISLQSDQAIDVPSDSDDEKPLQELQHLKSFSEHNVVSDQQEEHILQSDTQSSSVIDPFSDDSHSHHEDEDIIVTTANAATNGKKKKGRKPKNKA